jgi:hypothetical protein
MNDDYRRSADDALEPKDDIVSWTDNEEQLAEDSGTPYGPPDDIRSSSPIDEPSTDDGIDSDELYQEGLSGATNADDDEIDLEEPPRALDPED